ncbi:hypothetical protein [Nostoc sp. UHCC 0870]|uniref:hypothetical protein n=1 Tax=Nostoc sp. UHCC 0870 TaxID=2914041 RepID=UPI001EDD06F2|nr:hypothetical protein [Nostoc sp. UHCC 0870]UKO99489.1 hypothetical protein L6494_07200 [Nostoc sp. UHCC 0870]
MDKALKRFTTILLLSFFLIVSINFAVIAKDNQDTPFSGFSKSDALWIPWLFVAIVVIFLIFIFVFWGKNFLRSPGENGVCYSKEKKQMIAVSGKQNPYSLSLSQLAWWTGLIFPSYVFIYLTNGNYTIGNSALILLGINTGTVAVTSIIDGKGGKDKQKGTRRTSENYWEDIFSDGNGYNIHRFQAFLWTVFLGFIFIIQVMIDKKMPEFDSSLLALQGISSGNQLALRSTETQENKKDETPKNKLKFTKENDKLTLKEILINESNITQMKECEVAINENLANNSVILFNIEVEQITTS